MPSRKKQFNVRIGEEAERWVDELQVSLRASLGTEFSQADVVRMALADLRKHYPPLPGKAPSAPPEAPEPVKQPDTPPPPKPARKPRKGL